MSTGEKRPTAPATTPPATLPAQRDLSQPKLPQPVKNPLLSRRTFLTLAVGASAMLTGASLATSSSFPSPLIPEPNASSIIGNADDLDSALSSGGTGAKLFPWPWTESQSPYYRNVLVRLPDSLIINKSNTLSHFVAFNSTCVHLQCFVDYKSPQEALAPEWRLACPCHGSQYRMPDAVPVAGPALLLGLKALPQVKLTIDENTGNLMAVPFGDPRKGEYFDGVVGFGRDT